jgi:hypothetical protein
MIPDNHSVDNVWSAALALQKEVPSLREDILSKWEEFSQLLEDGTEDPEGHPKRLAMYATALALQQQLMERMIALSSTTPELLKRYARLDALPKMAFVSSALKVDGMGQLFQTLPSETLMAFRRDVDTMKRSIVDWQLTAASASVAAFSGWHYFRDMLYAYLDPQSVLKGGFLVVVALLKHFAVDVATKSNPVLGPALALAETVKSNTERRIEEVSKAAKEIDLIYSLEDAIKTGLGQVDTAEMIARNSFQHLDELEVRFHEAAARTRSVFELLAR